MNFFRHHTNIHIDIDRNAQNLKKVRSASSLLAHHRHKSSCQSQMHRNSLHKYFVSKAQKIRQIRNQKSEIVSIAQMENMIQLLMQPDFFLCLVFLISFIVTRRVFLSWAWGRQASFFSLIKVFSF